ncbi:sulfur carrier protein ThiS [Pseudoalteromonas aurantia]|uniref:Sulfur carrier protein n=1 Tax=Pseudoalteromonas aurantia 208 TaxID=1314867 RepID=A0ABR9EFD3_9GAMM|nr:sulfur carrier protein ThiS [Pseudoalteromonas aurantia]MBE0369701.1 sulfur carrier protein [Pseudoalteromonas aurantia 208]
MKVVFNGEMTQLNTPNLREFILGKGAKEPFAVAVNGEFVPRSHCAEMVLKAGDSIDLLSPIQGG